MYKWKCVKILIKGKVSLRKKITGAAVHETVILGSHYLGAMILGSNNPRENNLGDNYPDRNYTQKKLFLASIIWGWLSEGVIILQVIIWEQFSLGMAVQLL